MAMTLINAWGAEGHPTGKQFTKEALPGKVRAVIFNQDTCERFFEDYDSLPAAKDGIRRFSKDVVVDINDDRGETLFQTGESWNE